MKNAREELHLSDDALDDALLGVASAADTYHLAGCAACSGRLAEFRASLTSFNQASAAWSEARSNTISRELVPNSISSMTAAAWSVGSVAILAIMVSLTSYLHRPPEQPGNPAQQQSSGQQEIANDNAMLIAIDSKLSEPVQSPVVVYGEESAAVRTRRTLDRGDRD